MPHKDQNKLRAYQRQYNKEWRKNHLEECRARARKDAKLHRERHRHDLYQAQLEKARTRYCYLKARCKRHNLELLLTLEQYTEIITNFTTCHYCDRPVGKTGSALDRINNEPYYHYDNVVTCCARCNRVFNVYFNYEQKLVLAEAIKVCDKMVTTQSLHVPVSLEEE